jgi:CheY-like chemotaxis protein
MEVMLRRTIGEHIQLKTSLAPELWPVKVDPTQIGQVIVNLAVNARDAMPDGGVLTIETANVPPLQLPLPLRGQAGRREEDLQLPPNRGEEEEGSEYVLLTVSDTGVGMSQEIQPYIFEPFFTTKGRASGTGLGLATVYGIVNQSGGHIHVFSQEGLGATFKIYLPRSGEAAQPLPDRSMHVELPTGSETILLVDDDADVRELARRVLQWQGYTVLEAHDGPDALRLAASYAGPIHLLLTDVVMPGMSGTRVAEELARTRPSLGIIFMSGYTEEAMAAHGAQGPDVAFLPKPLGPLALARKVRAVLDARNRGVG